MSGVFIFSNTLRGNEAQSYVATMAQLDAVLAASDALLPGVISSPAPGSPMRTAYDKMLRDPYEQASLLRMVSEDHLRTILMILRKNVLPMFSVYSLLRPPAEADVRVLFLLDAHISERERLARGLSVRFENLREQSNVKSVPTRFAAASASIERKAIENGIAPVWSKPKKKERPRIIGFGQAMKKETELFRTYHSGGELLYRVLSCHVHARSWAWVDPQKAVPSGDPGVAQLKVELDISFWLNCLILSLQTHEMALIRVLELGGGAKSDWEKTKSEALDRVRPRYLELLDTGATPG